MGIVENENQRKITDHSSVSRIDDPYADLRKFLKTLAAQGANAQGGGGGGSESDDWARLREAARELKESREAEKRAAREAEEERKKAAQKEQARRNHARGGYFRRRNEDGPDFG